VVSQATDGRLSSSFIQLHLNYDAALSVIPSHVLIATAQHKAQNYTPVHIVFTDSTIVREAISSFVSWPEWRGLDTISHDCGLCP
jgi:hypothetical protein